MRQPVCGTAAAGIDYAVPGNPVRCAVHSPADCPGAQWRQENRYLAVGHHLPSWDFPDQSIYRIPGRFPFSFHLSRIIPAIIARPNPGHAEKPKGSRKQVKSVPASNEPPGKLPVASRYHRGTFPGTPAFCNGYLPLRHIESESSDSKFYLSGVPGRLSAVRF